MDLVINLSAVIFMFLGLSFIMVSQRMRTSDHPPLWGLNIRYLKPIWKMRDWFTPKGYRYHLIGWMIFSVGVMIEVVQYLKHIL